MPNLFRALWEVPRTWHKPTKAVSRTSLCKQIVWKRGCCVIHLRVGWSASMSEPNYYKQVILQPDILLSFEPATHVTTKYKINEINHRVFACLLSSYYYIPPEYKSSIHLKFYLRLPRSHSFSCCPSQFGSRSYNTRIHTTMYLISSSVPIFTLINIVFLWIRTVSHGFKRTRLDLSQNPSSFDTIRHKILLPEQQPRSQGTLSTSRKYPGYGWSRVY